MYGYNDLAVNWFSSNLESIIIVIVIIIMIMIIKIIIIVNI